MKKLRLSIEELAVETFDVDAAPLGRRGTVEARAAASWVAVCDSIEVCFPVSEGLNVALCVPTTVGEECVTDIFHACATTSAEVGEPALPTGTDC